MTGTFYEWAIGGVFFAPFVGCAALALVIILLIRPVLRLVGFARMFSHASLAELSLYVTILGIVIVLF